MPPNNYMIPVGGGTSVHVIVPMRDSFGDMWQVERFTAILTFLPPEEGGLTTCRRGRRISAFGGMRVDSLMELVERRFDELSRLQYRVFTCDLGGKHNPTALVLRFSGVYGVGSAGNGDADFMRVVTRAATSAWRCHAAVFDLRELAYEWGNSIWGVFGRGFEPSGVEGLPCALVVSDLCRGGFSTCQGLVPPMFNDLDSAVAFVGEPARAALDRMFAELDSAE